MIGSNSAIACLRIPPEIHHAMERTRILHRDERVALDHEFGYPHQHRKKVVVEGRRLAAQKFSPDLERSAKPECRAHINSRICDHLVDAALVDAQHIAQISETESHWRAEPIADNLHFRIGIDAIAECFEPRDVRKRGHPTDPRARGPGFAIVCGCYRRRLGVATRRSLAFSRFEIIEETLATSRRNPCPPPIHGPITTTKMDSAAQGAPLTWPSRRNISSLQAWTWPRTRRRSSTRSTISSMCPISSAS